MGNTDYLLPKEAAEIYRVHVRTLSRWADAGKLSRIMTVGGHRRYLVSELEAAFSPKNDVEES